MWEVLVEHAKTCILSHKLYIYYSDDVRNVGVVFNHIYELSGLLADGHYYPTDNLSESQKVSNLQHFVLTISLKINSYYAANVVVP